MTEVTDKAARLLGMARTAELGGNRQEAIAFYNRVLEDDPTQWSAWLGKGRCAGWASTLANIRLPEAVVAFRNAIGSAPASEKVAVADAASRDLVAISTAIWNEAWKHFQQFPSVEGQWGQCIVTGASILDALDDGRAWKPDDRASAELSISICKTILDQGVPADFAERLKSRLAIAVGEIRYMDPTYAPPVLAEVTVAERDAKDHETFVAIAIGILVVLGIIALVIATNK